MTVLRRSVTRLTAGDFPFRGGERRPVAVTLAPGDVLQFRFKGTRTTYDHPIGAALSAALRAHANAVVAAKKATRPRRRLKLF